ncbi:FAD-binding oxidoreductase [Arthrobacter sp. ISL-95]|uniref:FAD-binding oxidoreductase n=1 Tax=Arthrobacter sp. ISL-95 TaxID=2819116 RepID=UPI001BEB9450|nr:FAD-linked oxidase C-terminal domain-containing protein [Arthrobacter sp. ISL-95]MBT2586554.1 FAD-binding protein [Arthrobacter sp. ISL-95]
MHVAERLQAIERLRAALPGLVDTDPDHLLAYTSDRSGHRSEGAPAAAIHASTVEDVQIVCRIASETATPIVARGAGTGLVGGAIAGPGEILLSTQAMDQILEISVENRLAVVGPGILNGTLNRTLEQHGLWWAPDPASKDISTVGGNIAMNAGGLLCAKYGVTRESVLALKVVLADGRLLSVGHRTVKGVTGYDLCALMIGSEGTLGIIVEATLKLQPLVRGDIVTIGAFFDTVQEGARASAAITGAGHVPAIMELMDRRTLECVAHYTGDDLLSRGGAYFLVQCDGPAAADTAKQVTDLINAAGGRTETTVDASEAERLVGLRRQAFPALESMGTMLVEDIAVPRNMMNAAFAKIRELEHKYDLIIPTTCHAGDGNLHPTFVFNGSTVPETIWAAAGELFTYALEVGGTLTGEHGVGLLKRAWLADELGPDQYQLQRQIKAIFDPANILNPGKVFADS